MIEIKRRSLDGQTVRVEFGMYSLSASEAQALAKELQDAAFAAEDARYIHERHVDLLASCALCVYEVNGQYDRLTYEED